MDLIITRSKNITIMDLIITISKNISIIDHIRYAEKTLITYWAGNNYKYTFSNVKYPYLNLYIRSATKIGCLNLRNTDLIPTNKPSNNINTFKHNNINTVGV